jgi:hypothetical protein
MERESQRRAEVDEAEKAERLRMAQEQEARAMATQADALKTAEMQRRMIEQNMTRAQRDDVVKRAATVGVGGEIPAMLIPEMEKFAPELMDKLPAVVEQGAQLGVDEQDIPQYEVKETPGKSTYKGTGQEQAMEGLMQSDKISDEIKNLVRSGVIDGTALARILVPTTAASSKPAIGSFEDFVVRKYGENPTAEQVDAAREDYRLDPRESSPAPYSMPMQTAVGIVPYNTRANISAGESPWNFTHAAPSALPGAQRQALADNNAGIELLNTIEQTYKPEYTGFVQGRVGQLATKVVGEGGLLGGSEGSAKFYADITTLKNQVIKAITGAQMSEPEARRIMDQLPIAGISDDAFKARMASSKANMDRITKMIWEVGSGLRPPNPDAVTEEQMLAWYPEARTTQAAPGPSARTGGTGAASPASSQGSGEFETYEVNGVKFRRPKQGQ